MGNSIACRARWNVTKHARRTAKAFHEGNFNVDVHHYPIGYDVAGGYPFWSSQYDAEHDRLRRAAFVRAESNFVAKPEASRVIRDLAVL